MDSPTNQGLDLENVPSHQGCHVHLGEAFVASGLLSCLGGQSSLLEVSFLFCHSHHRQHHAFPYCDFQQHRRGLRIQSAGLLLWVQGFVVSMIQWATSFQFQPLQFADCHSALQIVQLVCASDRLTRGQDPAAAWAMGMASREAALPGVHV